MFLGESFCLGAYYLFRNSGVTSPAFAPSATDFNPLYCMIPAAIDLVQCSMKFLGLYWTYASVYQMLRGTELVWTAMFSILLMARRLRVFQWSSLFIIMTGGVIVGATNIFYQPETFSSRHLGSLLVFFFVVLLLLAVLLCMG